MIEREKKGGGLHCLFWVLTSTCCTIQFWKEQTQQNTFNQPQIKHPDATERRTTGRRRRRESKPCRGMWRWTSVLFASLMQDFFYDWLVSVWSVNTDTRRQYLSTSVSSWMFKHVGTKCLAKSSSGYLTTCRGSRNVPAGHLFQLFHFTIIFQTFKSHGLIIFLAPPLSEPNGFHPFVYSFHTTAESISCLSSVASDFQS